jgi:glycerate-2-kinase
MCLPARGVTLDDKLRLTTELLESGADIYEINTVRKHLSAVKGGQLAVLAGGSTVLSLIASDVVGDGLDTIASGPTVCDPTTYGQALTVLNGYDIEVPGSIFQHLKRGAGGELCETPKPGDSRFDDVHNLLVLPMSVAVDAVTRRAGEMGYDVLDQGVLEGESRELAVDVVEIARSIARDGEPVKPPAAIVSGGETTVTVRGIGSGGRNLEFALASLPLLEDNMVLAAIGTDGIDGNTDAAGAIVDPDTLSHSVEIGLDWLGYLEDNDSYTFLGQTGNLIFTGFTGTNVADLRVLLVGPAPENIITPAASNTMDEK